MTIRWRAMLLGPIFQAQGWNDSPFNIYPAKGRYMWNDLARICRRAEIPYSRPTVFPRNGLLAARVACAHDDAPWLGAFVCAVFRANFVDDSDIANEDVIAACLSESDADPAPVLERAVTRAAKQKLRERTREAAEAGIFGAPTFRVRDELFWGNEWIDTAVAAAR